MAKKWKPGETESLLIETKNYYFYSKIDTTQKNIKCRFCGGCDQTVKQI